MMHANFGRQIVCIMCFIKIAECQYNNGSFKVCEVQK